MPPPSFSPLTENVVLYSATAPSWFAWLLFSGGSQRRRITMFALVLAWSALAVAVVRYGIDAPLMGDFPGRTLVYLAVPLGLACAFRRWLTDPPLSQRLLVGLQLFRVVGMLFVLEWWRGVLPAVFAFPAGLGDLAVGLLAAWTLLRWPTGRIPARNLRILAYAGLLDFASAFFFGFTSSASPVQLFSFARPNPVDAYPTGLIPEFLVPFAIVAHVLSLVQVRPEHDRTSAPFR